jgi:hypothetical protein
MAGRTTKSRRQSGTRGVREYVRDEEVSQVQEQRPSNAGTEAEQTGAGSANEPQEGRPTVRGASQPDGRSERLARAAADGPAETRPRVGGMPPSEGEIDAPRDTATPGGALGTASYEELTEDPEQESSKSDDRTETEER